VVKNENFDKHCNALVNFDDQVVNLVNLQDCELREDCGELSEDCGELKEDCGELREDCGELREDCGQICIHWISESVGCSEVENSY
jgi:hypothetical protein